MEPERASARRALASSRAAPTSFSLHRRRTSGASSPSSSKAFFLATRATAPARRARAHRTEAVRADIHGVTARVEKQEEISRYIGLFSAAISRQVLIKAQVVEVTLDRSHNFGIDWQAV